MRDVFGRVATVAAFMMVVFVMTGCQTTEPKVITQVQIQKIEVPKSLLTCSSEPVYGSVVVTLKDLMRFADQVAKAGADCGRKLDAVKRIVEAQQQNPGFEAGVFNGHLWIDQASSSRSTRYSCH